MATLFVLCALTHDVLSQDNPCTVREDGKYYDLSRLKSRSARFIGALRRTRYWDEMSEHIPRPVKTLR